MGNQRIRWRLLNLEKALRRLDSVLAMDLDEEKTIRDSAVQRFGFTFECCWKALYVCLVFEGIPVTETPRRALVEAYVRQWLDGEDFWLQMLEDRNNTSHEYDEERAEEIYHRLPAYRDAIRDVLEKLRLEYADSQTLTGEKP